MADPAKRRATYQDILDALVKPLPRTLEVLRGDGEIWSILAVHQHDAKVREEPFEAIELDLAILWADVVL